jgi:hypothetical protein
VANLGATVLCLTAKGSVQTCEPNVDSTKLKQELLVRGQVQGPHIVNPLARWSIRQICFAPNVDHFEANLVFEKPGDEFLDLGH